MNRKDWWLFPALVIGTMLLVFVLAMLWLVFG
jgi:hypothetical protein